MNRNNRLHFKMWFWLLAVLLCIYGFFNIELFIGGKWIYTNTIYDYLYPSSMLLIAMYRIIKVKSLMSQTFANERGYAESE